MVTETRVVFQFLCSPAVKWVRTGPDLKSHCFALFDVENAFTDFEIARIKKNVPGQNPNIQYHTRFSSHFSLSPSNMPCMHCDRISAPVPNSFSTV